MLEKILKILREKVRSRRYVMTLHAEEEMDNDCLTIFDVEHCILTGKIIERQKDKATGEPKYRIHGRSLTGGKVEVIAKLGPTGKLVIITVYVA
jgi:hypothetical protein